MPRITRLLSACILAALLPLPAMSDDNNPEVRYRGAVMEAMGSHFSAMALVFTNKVVRPGDLAVHAEALATTAALTASLFPEGSQGGGALPLIWEEPAQVAEAAQRNADAAAALAAAAKGDDKAALAKAFKAAGDACKGCHERYKEDD